MTKPVRLQLSRKRGFNLQELSRATNGLEAVNVARPSRFGNPVRVGDYFLSGGPDGIGGPFRMTWCITSAEYADPRYTHIDSLEKLLDAFWFIARTKFGKDDLASLRGKNLACWCKLGEPCHADVLLELANPTDGP